MIIFWWFTNNQNIAFDICSCYGGGGVAYGRESEATKIKRNTCTHTSYVLLMHLHMQSHICTQIDTHTHVHYHHHHHPGLHRLSDSTIHALPYRQPKQFEGTSAFSSVNPMAQWNSSYCMLDLAVLSQFLLSWQRRWPESYKDNILLSKNDLLYCSSTGNKQTKNKLSTDSCVL